MACLFVSPWIGYALQPPVILPSLLLCDFGNLEREVDLLRAAGIEALHLDVMDGHFVPNLTYGMPLVRSLDRLTDMVLDVHLMISDPAQYVAAFVDAGADVVTIHVEATAEPRPILESHSRIGSGGWFVPESRYADRARRTVLRYL